MAFGFGPHMEWIFDDGYEAMTVIPRSMNGGVGGFYVLR
jgi:hypothetical protein